MTMRTRQELADVLRVHARDLVTDGGTNATDLRNDLVAAADALLQPTCEQVLGIDGMIYCCNLPDGHPGAHSASVRWHTPEPGGKV